MKYIRINKLVRALNMPATKVMNIISEGSQIPLEDICVNTRLVPMLVGDTLFPNDLSKLSKDDLISMYSRLEGEIDIREQVRQIEAGISKLAILTSKEYYKKL